MFHLIVGTFLLVSSCTSFELELDVSFGRDAMEYADTTQEFYWARSEGVRNVLRRATQMATIQWTPINNVPWNRGKFQPGSTVVGIPYSSTKQINKYVGLDVSFHTFMTAVHNPRSVLYTENLGKAPYFGTNCATYYGTVCSTCIDYALGLGIPYPSASFPSLPDFEEIETSNPGKLEPGDVLYRPGHVFMVYRVANSQEGTPITITYFEAGSKICCFEMLPAAKFKNKIISEGLRVFRYRKIDEVAEYEPSEFVPVGNELPVAVRYNETLCPNRGDRSVYRVDEPVIINSFDSTYTHLVVEGEDYSFSIAREEDMELSNLPAATYVAYMTSEESRSDPVEFVVADPQVTVQKGARLHIEYSCAQGEPRYCVFCDEVGGFKAIFDFTEEDRRNGFIDVDFPDMDNFYCKVVFKTPFGTVINNPIPVSR